MAQSQYREQFFLHRIRNVGWAGGVGVMEVRYVEISPISVLIIDPAEAEFTSFGEETIAPADYRNEFGLVVLPGNDGSVVAEDEIPGTWVIDGTVVGPFPDGPTHPFADLEADMTAFLGRPPDIHVEGGIVDFTHHLHTHPNGTTTDYLEGYEVVTSRPPDFDFTHSQESAWYHLFDRPQSDATILRKSWLINFANATTGKLEQTAIVLPFTTTYSLKVYGSNPTFTNSNGILTPQGGIAPSAIYSGSAASSDTVLRQFNRIGFLAG